MSHDDIEWCHDCSVLFCVDCDGQHSKHKLTKMVLETRRADLEMNEAKESFPDENCSRFEFEPYLKSFLTKIKIHLFRNFLSFRIENYSLKVTVN